MENKEIFLGGFASNFSYPGDSGEKPLRGSGDTGDHPLKRALGDSERKNSPH